MTSIKTFLFLSAITGALACGGGSKGDDTVKTHNPCGDNPCGDNPCGDNPCGDNPCGDNPCAASADVDVDWSGFASWSKVNEAPMVSKGHKKPWVNVYVTDLDAYRAGGEMKEGFAAVKAVHKDADGAAGEVAMLTVMKKMAADYDPDNGNWYYAAMSADGTKAMKEGKMEACIDCHSSGDDYLFSNKIK